MTPERVELLKELLREIVADGGFIPDEDSWRLVQKLVSWAAVEVLLTRNGGKEFLLRHRNDDFTGWHIIGGYVRPKEGLLESCRRNAKKDAGVTDVSIISGVIAVQKWLDHPYGYPVSIVIPCAFSGEVEERDDLRFFSEIPKDIINGNHRRYLEIYQAHNDNGGTGGVVFL